MLLLQLADVRQDNAQLRRLLRHVGTQFDGAQQHSLRIPRTVRSHLNGTIHTQRRGIQQQAHVLASIERTASVARSEVEVLVAHDGTVGVVHHVVAVVAQVVRCFILLR